MSIIAMFLLYLGSIFFAFISAFSKWMAVIVGVPLLLFTLSRLRKYFGYAPMIFAGMASWVSLLSMANVMLEWPIHRILMLILTVISSVMVGVGILLSYRKHYHQEPKIKLKVRERPATAKEKLQQYDERIRFKKQKAAKYGWIGWFMTEEDEQEAETELYFVLGRSVELDKEKTKD
ncbi:hypothetical protein [Salibacterium aidingense]|uniref:hypothetical protein n=1 Tax=Salibacterium aidingense TaxID=384933 RepID=UPI00040D69B0|nr:hypothetical protein [Salibacterium aidingense]